MEREMIEAENGAISGGRSLGAQHKRLHESIYPRDKRLAETLCDLDDALVRPMTAEKLVATLPDLVTSDIPARGTDATHSNLLFGPILREVYSALKCRINVSHCGKIFRRTAGMGRV